MTILVTGANGFVGTRFCQIAAEQGFKVRRAMRRQDPEADFVADITAQTNWLPALEGLETVVHLAARAHVLAEMTADPLAEFRKVNVQGTLNLARQAVSAGAKRFVFISSIGVHGRQSVQPVSVDDPPEPADAYAVSKYEAEQVLRQLEEETGLEVVIVRPPLIYGPGAPGNFGRLLRLVQKGLPLPFALVQNKRSLVAVDNLVDLILTCVEHPNAAGQTFLVSDGEDLSTPELIQRLARAMGRRPRLWPVPVGLLRLGGRMTGKAQEMERLISSLQVDIRHTCETLGWSPRVNVDEAMAEIGRGWPADHANGRE